MKEPLSPRNQQRVAEYYAKLITPLREVARKNGYALGVHGSIKRDIDIIAAPWTDEAVDPQSLADALLQETANVIGSAYYGCDGPFPRTKPHGRLCWTIHFNCTYIDLSVMPRVNA